MDRVSGVNLFGFTRGLLHRVKSITPTVYPKKYAHGFVVLCFVVVMQSFIMNSHEVFIHIHQGCFAGTGAIVRLPQCQWSKPDGYGKISQCITTAKHSKAKTMCIFLGIYCMVSVNTEGVNFYQRMTLYAVLVYHLPGIYLCKNLCKLTLLQFQLQIPLSNMTGVKYAIIFPYIGNILTTSCRNVPILPERPSQN